MKALLLVATALALASAAACAVGNGDGTASDPTTPADGGSPLDLGEATRKDAGQGKPKPGRTNDAGEPIDPSEPLADPVRFVTKVVSFTPGSCAGFGATEMPQIVLGPPRGAGDTKGSLDVVSLGRGGEIVLSFEPGVIVDGPGVDFVVFENAFFSGGNPNDPYVELAEVSVSEDGVTWTTFPCTASAAPYGACAGWHPVYSLDDPNLDPATSGGDPYDLATVGVARARFVRIKDKTAQRCTSQGPNTNGFDLDAIAAIHSEAP